MLKQNNRNKIKLLKIMSEFLICTDPDCQHKAVFTEALDCRSHKQCSTFTVGEL